MLVWWVDEIRTKILNIKIHTVKHRTSSVFEDDFVSEVCEIVP